MQSYTTLPGNGNSNPFDRLKAYIDSLFARAVGLIGITRSGSAAPTTSDIVAGKYAIWYNTSTSTYGIYGNNNGSIISIGGGSSITLTTTGSSGAATLIGSVLNIPQYTGGGTATVQYMWVVGGANNFSTLPGAPTPPGNGATTLVDSSLSGLNVRVVRGSFPLLGLDPGDGTQYYTKVKASNTLTFSSALTSGEAIIVETIPI